MVAADDGERDPERLKWIALLARKKKADPPLHPGSALAPTGRAEAHSMLEDGAANSHQVSDINVATVTVTWPKH